jgi:hypothetical protein
MYDSVRWVILFLLFAGLFALWVYAKRQAGLRQGPTGTTTGGFKVLQKRWIDQRTGVCLIEANDKSYLLAYTVGGSVSWQPLDKNPTPALNSPADPPITFPKV